MNMQKQFDSLSPEEKEKFKKAGERMYADKNMSMFDNPDEVLNESALYIAEGLKSGLHPRDLETNEIDILKTVFGKEWYKKFDYSEEDIKAL